MDAARTVNGLAAIFASAASTMGVYVDATARWSGTPVKDDGGSILTPGSPEEAAVRVQFDAPTHAMRLAEGFQEQDARLLVLAFDRRLDADARILVETGQWSGTWALLSVTGDPAGVGWECRGRRVS